MNVPTLLFAVLAALGARAAAQCEVVELIGTGAQDGDQFGFSLDLSGDRLLVTANRSGLAASNGGTAYVYELQGGAWIETAQFVSSDIDALDRFGVSCALDGDRALVGARYNQDAGYGTGSAYVFDLVGGAWTETAKLLPAELHGNTLFGTAAALRGDRLVVSAELGHGATIDEFQAGAVHVFDRIGGTWTETAKLLADAPQAGARFGSAVALAGDRLLVGARDEDGSRGAAYVFEHDGASWHQVARLTASDAAPSAFLGIEVALSGDTALLGALGAAGVSAATGAAYVFERRGGAWVQTAKLFASDGQSGDFFGSSVALDADRAVVGAWADDDAGSQAGAAYVFERVGGAWLQVAKLLAAGGGAAEIFGHDVDLEGDRALVSSKQGQDGSGADTGAASVFLLRGSVAAYGAGCPGRGGFVPSIGLDGCAVPGGALTFTLAQGLGGAPAVLLYGAGQGSLPVGGGCALSIAPLLPPMTLLVLGGSGPGGGGLVLDATLPTTAPTIDFTLQALVGDPAAVPGYSISNALAVSIE